MRPSIRGIAVLALAFTLIGAPAFAKDHGQGRGRDKQEEKADRHADKGRDEAQGHGSRQVRAGAWFSEHDRELAHRYYREHYAQARSCPPGLAKRNNGCLPPGQARKWRVGEPVPRGVVLYPVPARVLVHLPPAPVGYRYSRIGGDVALVLSHGNVVVDIMFDIFD